MHWRVYTPARGWACCWPRRWRRLHRKLCVVDGRVVFCGGINLLDDFHDPTHGKLDAPRFDFAVRVTGPLVADAHETMTRLWLRLQATREARHFDFAKALRDRARRRRAPAPTCTIRTSPPRTSTPARPRPSRRAGLLAGLVLRDNLRNRTRIERVYRRAIGQARREIIIANAYFVPGVRAAAGAAARRPARREGDAAAAGPLRVLHAVLRQPADVRRAARARASRSIEYAPSFLHAKVAVIDGRWATVGSSNLDPLSLLLAREANVFVRDDAFAAELRGHLLEAMQTTGARIDSSAHMKRPLHRAQPRLAGLRR